MGLLEARAVGSFTRLNVSAERSKIIYFAFVRSLIIMSLRNTQTKPSDFIIFVQ